MDKIIITERNRDGGPLWFEPAKGLTGLYTIHTDEKHEYMLNYASINYDAVDKDAEDYDAEFKYPDGSVVKGMIHSFDPSGGPYMCPGDIYNGYKLTRIYMRGDDPTYFKLEKCEEL